ncbi:MAG: HD domain-containing protein [Alphaproteobacteria bacterium]
MADKLIHNCYENQISRQEAKQLAGYYLQQRIYHGSNPRIIFEHGVHVFNVAKIAEEFAKNTNGTLDPDTAYVLGLLHDIGRIKDETVTNIPHGIEGFNYLSKNGYPKLAPICLTHCFITKDIDIADYPAYSPELLKQVKEYLDGIEYNDYDRVIQMADMFSRGKEILSIRQRLEKNKSFYHINHETYGESVYALRDYLNKKYEINVEKIVSDLFAPKTDSIYMFTRPHTAKEWKPAVELAGKTF